MRATDAAGLRARSRNLMRQAAEESDLWSVLADLTESGTPVALTLSTGARVSGTATRMGVDFVALRNDAGAVLVRAAAITTVQATGPKGLPWPGGIRPRDAAAATSLGGALSELADGERSVRFETAGGTAVSGDLQLVAEDFAVVRRPGGDLYVALDQVVAAWV